MTISRRALIASAAAASTLGTGPAHAQQPRSLTLGTAAVGGVFFVYGQVWANIAGEALGITISNRQTDGPNHNVILVHTRQIELGMTTMGVALQAWNGQGAWTQGRRFRDIRAMFPMYDTAFHNVALERSGIRSMAQLAGKNVGVGPRAGTPGTYFPLIYQALNIRPAAIRNGGASDMVSQLADGLIDCFCFAAGLPVPAFSEIEAQRPVTYFGFTDAEIATLQRALPELSPTEIPAGTYRTLTAAQKTVGVFNFSICHKDLSADIVYGIVKAVLENNPRMVQGHAASRETVIQNVGKNTFLPFHPGAVRYYREKGVNIPTELAPAS